MSQSYQKLAQIQNQSQFESDKIHNSLAMGVSIAIQNLYPNVHIAFQKVNEKEFRVFLNPISPNNPQEKHILASIQHNLNKIIRQNMAIDQFNVLPEEARLLFAKNPEILRSLEKISGLPKVCLIANYYLLARGPFVRKSGEIPPVELSWSSPNVIHGIIR